MKKSITAFLVECTIYASTFALADLIWDLDIPFWYDVFIGGGVVTGVAVGNVILGRIKYE